MTVYASDLFTGADTTLLDAHAPTTGTSWQYINGAITTGITDVVLLGNAVICTGTGTRWCMLNGTSAPATQAIRADFVLRSEITNYECGVRFRASSGGLIGAYEFRHVSTGAGSYFHLWRRGDDFVVTSLGSSYTIPYVAGTTIQTECRISSGGDISVYINGTLAITATDPSPLTGVKSGLIFLPQAGASLTSGVAIDTLSFQDPDALTATQLVVTTQPVGANSGDLFLTQPGVVAKNAGGLIDVSYAGTASVSLTGTGTLGGTVSGITFSGGRAAANDLYITGAGTATLTFASGALTGATTGTITTAAINVTAPRLFLVTPPAGFASGSPCTTPAVVEVRTGGGAGTPDTAWRGSITARVVTPSTATISGPNQFYVGFTANAAQATFYRVALTGAGATPVLQFTATPDASFAALNTVSTSALSVSAQTGTFTSGIELPRSVPTLPAWMAQRASGAADVTVTPASAAALQTQINTDAALVAGNGGNLNRDYLVPDGATWLTNITWPNRDPAVTGYMRVRCASAIATAVGTRTSAAAVTGQGILETNSSAAVFTTVAPNVGAQTNYPHHYALAGLTLRAQPGMGTGFILIQWGTGTNQDTLGKCPDRMILDRCVVDGGNIDQSHALFNAAGWHIVRDNAFLNIHSLSSDGGHAMTMGNGPGPGLIENNTLQCSGVILLFGGSDPNVPGLVPSDFTVRYNLLTRDPTWNRSDTNFGPTFPTTGWLVKNNLDTKNVQRLLFEGNVLENCWVDGQNGSLYNIKSVNQGGGAPHCGSSDVVLRKNFHRNAVQCFAMGGSPEGNLRTAVNLNRVWINDNVVINVKKFQSIGGRGSFDLTLDHNTWDGGAAQSSPTALYMGDTGDIQTRARVTNNLLTAGALGSLGPLGSQGLAAPEVFTVSLPGVNLTRNAFGNSANGWGATDLAYTNAGAPNNYLDGVTTASIVFTNSAIESTWATDPVDGICAALALTPGSPYHLLGTDGKDLGADIVALRAALAGGVQTATLAFTRQPVGAVSGGLLSVQPRVESRIGGVTDATDTRHVTFTLITLSGGPGLMTGTTSGNLVAGVFDPGNIHVAGAGVYEIGVNFG